MNKILLGIIALSVILIFVIYQKEFFTTIYDYDLISIKHNQKYLSILESGELNLSLNVDMLKRFKLVKVSTYSYAIKSSKYNRYLSINSQGKAGSNTYVGPDERFNLLKYANGKFSIKSSQHNRYLSITEEGNISSRTFFTNTEVFEISGINIPKINVEQEDVISTDDSYNIESVNIDKAPEDTSGYTMKGQTVQKKTCNFMPRGPTVLACQDRCSNRYDRQLWGGDLCTVDACRTICEGCKVSGDCHWIKDVIEDINVAESPVIKGYSLNGKVKITWANPIIQNKIIGYAVFINNLTDVNADVRMDYVSDVDCTSCEYIITNLVNNHRYQIYIKAKNNYGYSNKSNSIVIIPKEEPSPIHDIEDTTEDTKKVDDNISKESTSATPGHIYKANGLLGIGTPYDLSNNEMNQLASTIISGKGRLAEKYDINLFIN